MHRASSLEQWSCFSICRSASERFPGVANEEVDGEKDYPEQFDNASFHDLSMETWFRPSSKLGLQTEDASGQVDDPERISRGIGDRDYSPLRSPGDSHVP